MHKLELVSCVSDIGCCPSDVIRALLVNLLLPIAYIRGRLIHRCILSTYTIPPTDTVGAQ